MSGKKELLGLVATLRAAIDREESAWDTAVNHSDANATRAAFHELARLRARLSEAERDASEIIDLK